MESAQALADDSQYGVPPSETDGDLCLLVCDGGGVRGLSTLYIIKKLMEGIDSTNPPKPCDYFDMIGGTSTGGSVFPSV
jgi:patatin-like phospholipase/acyl hydrolase